MEGADCVCNHEDIEADRSTESLFLVHPPERLRRLEIDQLLVDI